MTGSAHAGPHRLRYPSIYLRTRVQYVSYFGTLHWDIICIFVYVLPEFRGTVIETLGRCATEK